MKIERAPNSGTLHAVEVLKAIRERGHSENDIQKNGIAYLDSSSVEDDKLYTVTYRTEEYDWSKADADPNENRIILVDYVEKIRKAVCIKLDLKSKSFQIIVFFFL